MIDDARAEAGQLKQEMPSGLDASIGLRCLAIRQRRDPRGPSHLSETLLIVVIVIFLFLGSVRSVLVPVMAILCH